MKHLTTLTRLTGLAVVSAVTLFAKDSLAFTGLCGNPTYDWAVDTGGPHTEIRFFQSSGGSEYWQNTTGTDTIFSGMYDASGNFTYDSSQTAQTSPQIYIYDHATSFHTTVNSKFLTASMQVTGATGVINTATGNTTWTVSVKINFKNGTGGANDLGAACNSTGSIAIDNQQLDSLSLGWSHTSYDNVTGEVDVFGETGGTLSGWTATACGGWGFQLNTALWGTAGGSFAMRWGDAYISDVNGSGTVPN